MALQSNTDSAVRTNRAAVGPAPDTKIQPSGVSGGTSATGGGGAVDAIIAGPGIGVSPAGGTGNVTVSNFGPVYNVLASGIIPDSSTDWSATLNTLIGTLPSGSILYFPGSASANYYRIDGLSSISKDIAFIGDSSITTIIKTRSTTATLLTTTGNLQISNLQFGTVNNRALTSGALLSVSGSVREVVINNVQIRATGNIADLLLSGGTMIVSNCNWKTLSPASGYVCKGAYGLFVNCLFNSTAQQAPAFIQVGAASGGFFMSNCNLGGGGPQYSYTPSAIASDGTTLTISLASTTGFNVGTWIVLNGMTTAGYNGFWRVTSVTANTNVKAVGNPFNTAPTAGSGTVGVGVAETVPATMVILGPLSQAIVSNCIFEANSYPSDPLSAGVFIDGTQGNGGNADIQFNGCYYDYGKVGALILGGGTNGSTITVQGISFNGGQILGNNSSPGWGGVWWSKVPGVKVNGLLSTALNLTSTSSWFYIYSDASIQSDGCSITACDVGNTQWNGISLTGLLPKYGLTVDGGSSTALSSLLMAGCTLWAVTAPVKILNGGITSNTYMEAAGNAFYSGATLPPTVVPWVPFFMPVELGIGAWIQLNGGQNFTTGVEAAVSLSAAVYDDTGGQFWSSGSPTVIAVPPGTVRMSVRCNYRWTANATGSRNIKIKDSGGGVQVADEKAASGNGNTSGSIETVDLPVAGLGITSFTIDGTQTSGGTLALAACDIMCKITR